MTRIAIIALSMALSLALTPNLQSMPETISIRIDSSVKPGAYQPIFSDFGYDEPNCRYQTHGRKLIREFAQLGPVPT